MDISVTEFKQRCLDLIRRVERSGEPITITRRGKVVARLSAADQPDASALKPWERLRAAEAHCDFEAEGSVLSEEDFEALT